MTPGHRGADGGEPDDAWNGSDAPDEEDTAWLDDEFPLGDGVADVDGVVTCPYCGEENAVTLDPGGGGHQEYVEDCQVCCQPWRVVVEYRDDGSADVYATPADGS